MSSQAVDTQFMTLFSRPYPYGQAGFSVCVPCKAGSYYTYYYAQGSGDLLCALRRTT